RRPRAGPWRHRTGGQGGRRGPRPVGLGQGEDGEAMTKRPSRPSLEDLAGAVAPKPTAPKPGKPPPAQPPVRVAKPHVSVYLDKRVQRVIKQIALDYDRKVHDLYIEAVDLMLARYGQPTVAEIAPEDDAGT